MMRRLAVAWLAVVFVLVSMACIDDFNQRREEVIQNGK